MSRIGAAPCAAVSVSGARAEASRRNGAKSRGPKTPAGKARSAQNALKHGMRAQKYVVLPEEDAAEFAVLEAALIEELAPVGALQIVLARRIAVAAWRLARADRIETELFEERRFADGGLGLALIRDGNGTRSFETLLRYRGAAMAEFWRALRTLKALQAEQKATPMRAAEPPAAVLTFAPGGGRAGTAIAIAPHHGAAQPGAREENPIEPEARAMPGDSAPAAPAALADEPESGAGRRLEYSLPEPPASGRTLHEPAAPWLPNEPEPRQHAGSAPARPDLVPNQPEPHRAPRPDHGRTTPPPAPAPSAMPRHGFPGSHGPSEQMPDPWLRTR